MNGAHFQEWFEYKLPDSIPAGSTVIMDRTSFHRKKLLEEICAKAEVNLLFLPAYAPDFNPIEKDWANMKRALRDTAPSLRFASDRCLRLLTVLNGSTISAPRAVPAISPNGPPSAALHPSQGPSSPPL
jgi:transposase